jgi:hypothetical protein
MSLDWLDGLASTPPKKEETKENKIDLNAWSEDDILIDED